MSRKDHMECPFRQHCEEYNDVIKILNVIRNKAKTARDISFDVRIKEVKVYRILNKLDYCGFLEVSKKRWEKSNPYKLKKKKGPVIITAKAYKLKR